MGGASRWTSPLREQKTVAGDLETALVQASGAAIAGRILFVITLIFETMAVVSHHFAARDRT